MEILLLISTGSEFHIYKISTFHFEDKSLPKLKAAFLLVRQGGGHQAFCLLRSASWEASPTWPDRLGNAGMCNIWG